jgi:hypothetical protein
MQFKKMQFVSFPRNSLAAATTLLYEACIAIAKKMPFQRRFAVVVDIDDTLLHSEESEDRMAPVRRFVSRLKKALKPRAQLDVIVVTAREDNPEVRSWTMGHLRDVNFYQHLRCEKAVKDKVEHTDCVKYDELHLCPKFARDKGTDAIAGFKESMRLKVMSGSSKTPPRFVLCTIGDANGDLAPRIDFGEILGSDSRHGVFLGNVTGAALGLKLGHAA